MEKEIENPPAFAKSAFYHETGGVDGSQSGMTLRDYFAAKAMNGYFAAMDEVVNRGMQVNAKYVAAVAYDMADEMLKARNK